MNSVHITLNYSWDAIEASNASSSAVIAPSFLDFSKVIAKIVQRISTAPTRSVNKGCWLNTTTCNHSLSIKTPGIAEFRIYQWCTWTPNAIRICSDLIIFITHWNVLFDRYFCCPEKSRLNSWWHICVHTCVFKEIKKINKHSHLTEVTTEGVSKVTAHMRPYCWAMPRRAIPGRFKVDQSFSELNGPILIASSQSWTASWGSWRRREGFPRAARPTPAHIVVARPMNSILTDFLEKR